IIQPRNASDRRSLQMDYNDPLNEILGRLEDLEHNLSVLQVTVMQLTEGGVKPFDEKEEKNDSPPMSASIQNAIKNIINKDEFNNVVQQVNNLEKEMASMLRTLANKADNASVTEKMMQVETLLSRKAERKDLEKLILEASSKPKKPAVKFDDD